MFHQRDDTLCPLYISDSTLKDLARAEMLKRGFHPDFSDQVRAQVADLEAGTGQPPGGAGVRDLRDLLWSSIDNDTSRDFDQIEVAEALPNGATRVLIGIAGVAASVAKASPIDMHAHQQGTSVYTGVETFPMLPEELSEGLTSLLEGEDRLSVVIEFIVDQAATVQSGGAYIALVRNHAQLTYSGAGPWLEGSAAPPVKVGASTELQAQIKLQDQTAQRLGPPGSGWER